MPSTTITGDMPEPLPIGPHENRHGDQAYLLRSKYGLPSVFQYD